MGNCSVCVCVCVCVLAHAHAHGHSDKFRGGWVAESVKYQTLAQVMISWFVSSSPTSGSVLTARSLEPASDSVFPSLFAPPLLTLCLSKKNKCNNNNNKKEYPSHTNG